jgi:hypothetical protein
MPSEPPIGSPDFDDALEDALCKGLSTPSFESYLRGLGSGDVEAGKAEFRRRRQQARLLWERINPTWR